MRYGICLLALWITGVYGLTPVNAQPPAIAVLQSAGPPKADVQPADVPPMGPTKTKPDNRVHVMLSDGSQIVGKLVAEQGFELAAKIGKVNVSAKDLAALVVQNTAAVNSPKTERDAAARFAQPAPAAVTVKVQLRNGDHITGKLQTTSIRLKAVWGEINVELKHLVGVWSPDYAASGGGPITIQRPVVETLPNGATRVRIVTQVLGNPVQPAGYASPYTYPSTRPQPVPAGAYAPAAPVGPPVSAPATVLPPPGAIPNTR